MDREQLFHLLIHEYLFVSVFRAFADLLASENASRQASMQVAEKNLEDRLQALTMEARRLRQDSITAELKGIISSFEALHGREAQKSGGR
jgi:F-type H+-transporting ATPase subunit gamma